MSKLSDTVIVRETCLSDITWKDEMDTLEKDLKQIVSMGKEDKTNNLGAFKNLVNNLHEQIAFLTDDIKFLREDSINKSNIINSLLSIINGSQNKVLLNHHKSLDDDIDFNDSTYDDHVDDYNENISNYNNDIDGPDIGMQSTMIGVNALNKSTQDKINDLRETSLCYIMSNNSITSNSTTLIRSTILKTL